MQLSHGIDHASYTSALDGKEKIAGFGSLWNTHNWTVVISEHKEAFSKPLADLFDNALWSAAGVGLVFIGIALLFAQVFLRPIRRLTAAADAVKRADYAHPTLSAKAKMSSVRLQQLSMKWLLA